MVKVKISEKGGQQSNYEFDKPEVTVGRMKGNDIVLPKGNVSKKHARIYGRNGTLMIDDLDSTNGTYVNGRKVTSEHEITENDKIYIGDFILQVEPDQQQQAGGPPQAPPQPPGGDQEAEPGGGPNISPSSRGDGGMPADAGAGRAGTTGSGSPGSAPSARPGGGGAQGGGPQQDAGPSGPGSHGGGGIGGSLSESGREGSNPLDARGDNFGGEGDSAPNHGPGSSRNQSSLGQGPSGSSSDGGRGAENRRRSRKSSSARNASVGGSAPRRESPDGSAGRGGGGLDVSPDKGRESPESRGRNRQANGPAGGPTGLGTPRDSSRRERPGEDVSGERREDRIGGQPILPPELESEFDENFHEAQQQVAEELFEEIRPEELPLTYPPLEADREEYEELVRDAVRRAKPRRVDRDALIEVMTDEVVALGPIENYLDDPETETVYVNRFDSLVLRRGRDIVQPEHAFSHPQFLELAAHRLLDSRDPEVLTDEIHFDDGTRVHVTLPPITVDGPVLTFRKPPANHPSLVDLSEEGVLSEGMRSFLSRSVETGRSILVAGPTSSGKSTLLGSLAREIPDASRIVAVEQISQLDLPQQGVVRLESRPEAGFDLEEVLEAAVEMHPQRVILDECRGGEAYTWVSSAASATEGSMATVHGVNASDALGRLESLCLLGSGDISPRGLREQIARAVDLVVVIHRVGDGTFRVKQIAEVQGVDLDAFRLNDVFYYRTDGTSGAFHPTGYIPLFYEDLRHLGMDVDLDIFRE